MRGIRAQQYGGYGASLLAALLWLSLLPQHAQAADPASNTSAINTSTTETMGTTPPLSEICGKTQFQGRIFGGETAKPERWPWQVSLRLYGRHICGAVLIDKNWIAGAAHCFQRSHNPKDYQVRIGYTKMSSPTKYSREMSVYKLIVHKDYDRFHRQGSDIVLMQLESPVEYSSHILPACVPDKNIKLPKEKACWASGWGNLREDVRLPLPDDLQEVKLILMDNEDCKMFFPKPAPGNTRSYYIYDDMMCAADYSMTKSICSGDSGGPFVCLLEGSWYVVGLTSWSSSCETPITTPSVFARVSYFDNWIKEHKLASPDPKPWEPGRPPYNPNDPGGGYHWNNNKDKGTVIKPMMCMALLSSWVLLLQMILLRNL
ncbi:serine protease 40 [Cricetulus griseus]|uniref:Serine protease 40 n=1 Tax=Cricetulus griseus TaxID=10029 RepID=G3H1T3_CRIGR|nr:serine protease 40 [Cricetulus griseus]XP_027242511.1 serine protease 40 [Cricetulus griseus]EGW06475.1 Testicular serine protease 2 [Cricetulus griseus]